jgi:hypothetical protein
VAQAPVAARSTGPLSRPVLHERWQLDGTLLGPSSIAQLDASQMLVVDECRHELVVLDEDGAVVRRIGGEGAEPGRFRYPTHAVADGEGGAWVTDRWNHRVQHVDAAGRPLNAFGTYGPAAGEFNEPWGVALLDGGNLIVADRANHRLQAVSLDGTPQAIYGRGGCARDYYEGPSFKRGFVFQRWSELFSRFVSHELLFREQGYAVGTLEHPQGIAACGPGRVLVADPGVGAVLVCTLESGEIELFWRPRGIHLVPTSITALRDGLYLVAADAGPTACLLDASGRHVLFNVPGLEHLTACAPGPGSTLWCLDGWNRRLVCFDFELAPAEDDGP